MGCSWWRPVIVAVGMDDVSAAHLNSAVTIGFAAGGYVTVIRCALYTVAQLLGSAAACFLLVYITGGGGQVHNKKSI